MSSLIFDFETLSHEPSTAVVLSLATLVFDESTFFEEHDFYTFNELYFLSDSIKFNVEEQIQVYNRKISKGTLDWWSNQSSEARAMIQPRPSDKSISVLPDYIQDKCQPSKIKSVYVRGTSFDPVILESLYKVLRKPCPIHWGKIRDTRSFIAGLAYGTDIKHNFMIDSIKDKVVLHNPVHDIILDVLRMQLLIRAFHTEFKT
jgi:hypothetical protein